MSGVAPARNKHVIFLGAGASFTSGYPLANELRVRLCSPDRLYDLAQQACNGDESVGELVLKRLRADFEKFKESVELFRFGGFATVDEFCRLAGGSKNFARAVLQMRHLTMLVLALCDPEREFHKVGYYPFVQKLFDHTLHALRDEIVILSFNYDVYLEHLVLRAYRKRCEIAHRSIEPEVCNAIVSGFLDQGAWAERGAEQNGFAILKLHGSIAEVHSTEGSIGHEDVLVNSVPQRLQRLGTVGRSYHPQIAFPWELFGEDGSFLVEEKFPDVGYNKPTPYRAFASTWKRARAAVRDAKRVSFIGLSMHDYLEPGMRYLFAERYGHIEIVNADPGNGELMGPHDVGPSNDPRTPVFKLRMMLQKSASLSNYPEHTAIPQPHDGGLRVRCRADFADFINTEMGRFG